MLEINFNPFPNLESDRLQFRRITEEDVNEIFALRSNPTTMQFIPRPFAKTTQEALDHIAMIESKIIANEGINWAITLKNNPKLIGIIGHYRLQPDNYRSEIGYMLLPEYQGQGITSEAVDTVVKYGFRTMKLHSIEALIDPANTASAKVLEKNKFIKEGHLKENIFFAGSFHDSVIYSIIGK